ncbi:MAG: sigma-70 family RNA polymerase sigma factor [Chloroflexota bacterium]|nr:sigma-70 family RNA polymerase sigma factor [Chloroflexota bacterium]
MRRHQGEALRVAVLITRDRALAEDIVQAAFLRAYERIDQFDADRPFAPWFLQGVVRDAVKLAARQRRQIPLDGLECAAAARPAGRASPAGDDPLALLEGAETRQEIAAALAQLTPAQRAVLVQRHVLGLSERAMAASLALPPGTVKSRLHGARARLRRLLRPTAAATVKPGQDE